MFVIVGYEILIEKYLLSLSLMMSIVFYRNIFNKPCANFSFVDYLDMEDSFFKIITPSALY
jgi:hypothetical protein